MEVLFRCIVYALVCSLFLYNNLNIFSFQFKLHICYLTNRDALLIQCGKTWIISWSIKKVDCRHFASYYKKLYCVQEQIDSIELSRLMGEEAETMIYLITETKVKESKCKL